MTEASPRITGRRERKKLATRQALSSAALQLAMERGGIENVTIEDITTRADVALRTFSNYFANKYEAITAMGSDRARRIGASRGRGARGGPGWVGRSSCGRSRSRSGRR
jgi:AcrR family transcriptional regulator